MLFLLALTLISGLLCGGLCTFGGKCIIHGVLKLGGILLGIGIVSGIIFCILVATMGKWIDKDEN